MRLRTLPVSVAGVIAGIGCAVLHDKFSVVPAILCLLFAVLAQIASNFGNEYYDYKNGFDKKGRVGFRRGVTEGDISPEAMRNATFYTLTLAALIGCALLFYGEWWLLPIGFAIALFALAYSTGPYPLSHHGLGDVAVIIFFGVVPVNLTCYLQMGDFSGLDVSLLTSLAVGLMAANVLVVNNYRDMDDDKAVGKRTTVVVFGLRVMGWAYLCSGIVAFVLVSPVWRVMPRAALLVPIAYLLIHCRIWSMLRKRKGVELNPLLGMTSANMLLYSLLQLIVFCLVK